MVTDGMTRSLRIVSWGAALPEKIITNADLESTLDTTDQWIVERTGIRERRVGGTTTGLAIQAGHAAMAQGGYEPGDIDLLVLCTTTPDQQLPASASTVQHDLGLSCGAFDLNAACSGFVYGLVTAFGLGAVGLDRILLIGAEVMSRLTNWEDRGTAILFGDGAGAVVLEATEVATPADHHLLAFDLGSDGAARDILYADIGSTMLMDGKEVFRRAIRAVVQSAGNTLEAAGKTVADVALWVPHQANVRIVEGANLRLGFPPDRIVMNLERHGNTSAASVPLALAEAADAGRLSPGDLVLMVGFGAGMTWASALVRWEPGR
jgi:3-oxoacyl-[acyl-carrier-protein] synthase III